MLKEFVCFVEHKNFKFSKIESLFLNQIEYSSRSPHHDVGSLLVNPLQIVLWLVPSDEVAHIEIVLCYPIFVLVLEEWLELFDHLEDLYREFSAWGHQEGIHLVIADVKVDVFACLSLSFFSFLSFLGSNRLLFFCQDRNEHLDKWNNKCECFSGSCTRLYAHIFIRQK